VRISPRDAQRGFSRNGFSDKVSGDAVYHFGAFFKRSWRSNDILWGRLDATCQLSELLFDRERIAGLLNNDISRSQLRDRFFGKNSNGLDPAQLFPHAGAITQERLRQWISNLLSASVDTREQALEEESFNGILNLLIAAEQHEIINCELPNVITDAIVEQSYWNRFQILPDGSTPAPAPVEPHNLPWTFQPPQGQIDRLLASTFAALTMNNAMNSFSLGSGNPTSPMDTRLGQFFRQSYRVGSETLSRDVPPLILMEIIMTVLMVVRNCIFNVLGKKGDRIRRHPLYRFGIDYPMRIMHSLVLVVQRYPGWRSTLFFVCGIVSILALLVGIIWHAELIGYGKTFSMTAFVIFILAPLWVLLIESAVLFFQHRFTAADKKAGS